jgi:hypothetical protein
MRGSGNIEKVAGGYAIYPFDVCAAAWEVSFRT